MLLPVDTKLGELAYRFTTDEDAFFFFCSNATCDGRGFLGGGCFLFRSCCVTMAATD